MAEELNNTQSSNTRTSTSVMSTDSPMEIVRSSNEEPSPLLPNIMQLSDPDCKTIDDEVFDFEIDSPIGKSIQRSPNKTICKKAEMSPLSASQIVELFKEAQSVVISLKHASGTPKHNSKKEVVENKKIKEIVEDSTVTDEPSPLLDVRVPARSANRRAQIAAAKEVLTSAKENKVTNTPAQTGQAPNKMGVRKPLFGRDNAGGKMLQRSASFNRKSIVDSSQASVDVRRSSLKRSSSFTHQSEAKRHAVGQVPAKKIPAPLSTSFSERTGLQPPKKVQPSLNSSVSERLGPRPVKKLQNPLNSSVNERSFCNKKPPIQSSIRQKPQLKTPMMKQSLLQKPSGVQSQQKPSMGKLNRLKPAQKGAGPLKAVMSAVQKFTPSSQKETNSELGTETDCHSSVSYLEQPTPLQSQKRGNPKRLMQKETTGDTTPEKNEDTAPVCSTPVSVSKSNNRRSFLPTPNKLGSTPSRRQTMSSSSSFDSICSSPVTRGMSPRGRPALGILVDINGVNEYSPSCLKPRKTRVLHTPVNKDGETQEPKRSIWSPVRRKKLAVDDEVHHCTKRTSQH